MDRCAWVVLVVFGVLVLERSWRSDWIREACIFVFGGVLQHTSEIDGEINTIFCLYQVSEVSLDIV